MGFFERAKKIPIFVANCMAGCILVNIDFFLTGAHVSPEELKKVRIIRNHLCKGVCNTSFGGLSGSRDCSRKFSNLLNW